MDALEQAAKHGWTTTSASVGLGRAIQSARTASGSDPPWVHGVRMGSIEDKDMRAGELICRIHAEFDVETQRVFTPEVLRMYRDGYADGTKGVDARLQPGFELADLSAVEPNLIYFATPEVAIFVLGSFLLCMVDSSSLDPRVPGPERYTDNLLESMGATGIWSKHQVEETYSLLSKSQREVVEKCLKYVVKNRLYGWEDAAEVLTLGWVVGPVR